jgi:DNA gyrase subunit A
MRAAVQKETRRGGKEQLVVTALPYGVSKAKVIEQIAQVGAHQAGRHRGPAGRVGPRRHAHRHRAEARREDEADPGALYKQTYLQATFGAIMLALDTACRAS